MAVDLVVDFLGRIRQLAVSTGTNEATARGLNSGHFNRLTP